MSTEDRGLQHPVPKAWLLDGHAYVRYRTLVGVLGYAHEGKEVHRARAAVVREPAVRELLNQRNKDGYWGTPDDIFKWWPKKNTTFWVLGVLADFGLTRDDAGIQRACEYVLSTQLPSGAFGLRSPPNPYDCFTGVLVAALARLGYLRDHRLEHAYAWILERQRLDGGFWCKETGQPGGPREREPSCALASLWMLSALAVNPVLLNSDVCRKCSMFLLGCWSNRGKLKYAGHDSQIGSGWEKLKYPFTDYRILHYLDTLSHVPFIREDVRVVEIAKELMSKRDVDGRFQAESINNAWSQFDFGQKRRPSKWLTCLAYGILARLGFWHSSPNSVIL